MTFMKRLLKELSVENDTGVKWEFAFTVTEKMREAARQRSSRKWKPVQGFSKIGEKVFPGEILESKP